MKFIRDIIEKREAELANAPDADTPQKASALDLRESWRAPDHDSDDGETLLREDAAITAMPDDGPGEAHAVEVGSDAGLDEDEPIEDAAFPDPDLTSIFGDPGDHVQDDDDPFDLGGELSGDPDDSAGTEVMNGFHHEAEAEDEGDDLHIFAEADDMDADDMDADDIALADSADDPDCDAMAAPDRDDAPGFENDTAAQPAPVEAPATESEPEPGMARDTAAAPARPQTGFVRPRDPEPESAADDSPMGSISAFMKAQKEAAQAQPPTPTPAPAPPAPEAPPQPMAIDVPAPAAGRGSSKAGRVKTRLLGFNSPQVGSADPFATETARPDSGFSRFPVGWLSVVQGPGRGSTFTLYDGVAQIGRGEDQTVRLDFGDNAISRQNHAAIAYDPEQRKFYVGHGGKTNLVRRNNFPVLSTQEIESGDLIRVGETTLRFVALCGDDFSWDEAPESEARHAVKG